MQGDYNRDFENRIVFDVDLLHLIDVFQLSSDYRVHSIQKEANLKLQNTIDGLVTCILKSALLAFQWFFVLFACLLMSVFSQFYLQLIVGFPCCVSKITHAWLSAPYYLDELKQIHHTEQVNEIDF